MPATSDIPVFLDHADRLSTLGDLLAAMRRLAFDLSAAADAGLVAQSDLAEGLAAVIIHAANSIDGAVGVSIDLDVA